MCWVAIDRGASLAHRLGRMDLAEKWRPIADSERAEVLRRGYNEQLGFFTQALDGQHPDASLLLLPTIGIIDARDPRFVSTVDAYERLLVSGGLMRRYIEPRRLRRDAQRVHHLLVLVGGGARAHGPARSRRSRSSSASRATPTRWASSARTSIPTPARCSATSRRRTRTSA